MTDDGYILEFGSGMAGYAILVPPTRRRALNIMMNPNRPRLPARKWEEGSPVSVPGVGSGHFIAPHPKDSKLSKVKIGDMVPCYVPTSHLQDPPPRRKRVVGTQATILALSFNRNRRDPHWLTQFQ